MDAANPLAWIATVAVLSALSVMTLRKFWRRATGQVPVVAAMVAAGEARNRVYLRNNSLTSPQQSSLRRLLDGKDNKAYILTMGVSVAMFEHLHDEGFREFYLHEFTKQTKKERAAEPANGGGRPQRLSTKEALAATLLYMRNECTYDPISILAGAGPAVTCRVINAGLVALLATLNLIPDAEVVFPNHAKQAMYAALVRRRLRRLRGCFAFVDGLAITVQRAGCPTKQNEYYSGYKAQNKITNVFIFAPDGRVIYESVNHPGSWADSSAFSEFMNVIERPDQELIAADHWIAADAAFRATKTPCLRKVLSKKALKKLHQEVRAGRVTRRHFKRIQKEHRDLTTCRQSVEHGMRALRTFRRLNTNLTINNDAKRLMIVNIATRLHNFRAARLPLNHIARDYDAVPEAALNVDL